MSKQKKYWSQMNFLEWMWQEKRVQSIAIIILLIVGLVMMYLDVFA